MKKLCVFLITLLLLMCCISGAAFAMVSDNIVVVFEKQEIKDHKTLFERAKKGITDYDGFIAEWEGSKELKVDKYLTTQKLKSVKDKNGSLTTSYVTTGIFKVQPLATGSKIDPDQWDITGGVNAVISVYWETIQQNPPYGATYNRVTKSEVAFYRYDSSISIKSNSTYVYAKEDGSYWDPVTNTTGICSKSCFRAYPGATFGYIYSCSPQYYASDWPWPYVIFDNGRVVGYAETQLQRGSGTPWYFKPIVTEGKYVN